MKTILNNIREIMLIAAIAVAGISISRAGETVEHPEPNYYIASFYEEYMSYGMSGIEEWMTDPGRWVFPGSGTADAGDADMFTDIAMYEMLWHFEEFESGVIIEDWMTELDRWDYTPWHLAYTPETDNGIEGWMVNVLNWDFPDLNSAGGTNPGIEEWMSDPFSLLPVRFHDCAQNSASMTDERKLCMNSSGQDRELHSKEG